MPASEDQAATFISASSGFDLLFANRMDDARAVFQSEENVDSPFHLMGLGVCAFLEAALGMETERLTEASRCLALCEAGTKKFAKAAKAEESSGSWLSSTKKSDIAKRRLPAGIEWEILHADAVLLMGMTHALSESYMGYVQCLYSLNSAHSKFTAIYKTVFPHGLESYSTPATTPLPSTLPSRNPSPTPSSSANMATFATKSTSKQTSKGFFGRWNSPSGSNGDFSVSGEEAMTPVIQPDGPVEEMIVSGAAFGFGLFNLVFSLMPAKVKTVVGFFGFQHDRRLAQQALAVSAARSDIHAVFAGLTLMTYHGIVLLLAGFQADEAYIVKQYRAIVNKLAERYPDGSLWILNQAKILRMTTNPEGAIAVLQEGLRPDRPERGHFREGDALLVFELAWTLLSERRYKESAEMFMRMTELNSWSHATYYFIAAGCYLSLSNSTRAQELVDAIPALLDKRKLGGKDLPTEVFIRRKIAFYRRKQKRRGGKEEAWIESVRIGLADELGIFWNMHARIRQPIAHMHIKELCGHTPAIMNDLEDVSPNPHQSIMSLPPPSQRGHHHQPDLDTPDELAVRSLLLGILYRTLGEYNRSKSFFEEALGIHSRGEISSEGDRWVGGVALFETAVWELKMTETSASTAAEDWTRVLRNAEEKLDRVMSISGANVDLSSRLDSRVNMLRGEIALKREMLSR